MDRKNKILFFGPYPEPLTGQSISFRQVFQNFKGPKILFDSTSFKGNKLLNSLYCFIFLPVVFLTRRFNTIYFTCTRSNFGFLKDFVLLLLARVFNKNVVNHLHGADLIDFYQNSGGLKRIIKWSYEKININIVLLPSMVDQLSEFNKSKTEVVYNCFSSDFEESSTDFSEKKQQITFLSNLIYSKGVFVFLDSVAQILKRHSNVVVKIAGAPMGDEYMTEKQVRVKFNKAYAILKEKYADRIFYLGTVKGKEKEELLKESAVFILPTFYKTEAFPLTIIEAMYFGNAIVTTNHNYLADIVNPDNGYLVTPRSTEEIIEKIDLLLMNQDKLIEMQRTNRSEAKLKYNPENFNKRISQIITSL